MCSLLFSWTHFTHCTFNTESCWTQGNTAAKDHMPPLLPSASCFRFKTSKNGSVGNKSHIKWIFCTVRLNSKTSMLPLPPNKCLMGFSWKGSWQYLRVYGLRDWLFFSVASSYCIIRPGVDGKMEPGWDISLQSAKLFSAQLLLGDAFVAQCVIFAHIWLWLFTCFRPWHTQTHTMRGCKETSQNEPVWPGLN